MLCAVESLSHGRLLFQGLNYHLMLYGFLKQTLNAAVRVSDFTCQVTHSFHIDFAHHDEKRNNGYGEAGQRRVHGIKKEECTRKTDPDGNDRRQCFRDGIYHIGYIAFQPVEYVTAVPPVTLLPLAVQEAVEISELHVILRLDPKNGFYPPGCETDAELRQQYTDEQGSGCGKLTGGLMGSNVDNPFGRTNECEVQNDGRTAEQCIEYDLQSVKLQDVPQPFE